MKLKKAHKLTKIERAHLKEMKIRASDTETMNRRACSVCDSIFYKLQARKRKD
jgi:hypothetical protein